LESNRNTPSKPDSRANCEVALRSKSHGVLLHRIRSEGGEIGLLVTLSPEEVSSFNLVPEVSRICGELGITLEFDMTND
jgi:hypothetical protein